MNPLELKPHPGLILDTMAHRDGLSFPLGAAARPGGVNFCIFSKHSTGAELLLFDNPCDPQPSRVLKLDATHNRTYFYWHVFVPGIQEGQVYAWRMQGPYDAARGLRFDPEKVLLDPFTRAVANWENYNRGAASRGGDNCAQALRSVVVNSNSFDWGDDVYPRIPYAKTIIYEMHVGGFTRNANSGLAPEKRGTFAGLIEKIPYLKELGITAVELMPVCQFDEQDASLGKVNYWGYSPIAMFAPHARYSSQKDVLGPVNEFKQMVRALHHNGIEVILDVVYNHTAEGNQFGPTVSFKGLDNPTYYMLEFDRSLYRDYSGCGNTFNANHNITGHFIMECLRYWVEEMHVDGFRFDLAASLTRDVSGVPDPVSILWTIESDPVLAGTKLIAEAWDSAGLYQVGNFVNRGDWFAEWNGPFRDDIRRIVKGDKGSIKPIAQRLLGSPDIYTNPDTEPNRSIDFITCHDGFTLNDLVSYNNKHNDANGENGRDGNNSNHSWNCGFEGPTDDPKVEELRKKQIKNFLTILFISQGTPMLLMGDECRRTQNGNNNAYCHDTEMTWFDWTLVEKNAEILDYTKKVIKFTQSLQIFQQRRQLSLVPGSKDPHIIWHGTELRHPDWNDDSHTIAFTLVEPSHGELLHVMLNEYWKPLTFALPTIDREQKWHRIIDTSLAPGEDITQPAESAPLKVTRYKVPARSCVVLMALPPTD
jgi:isoamylase